MPGITRFHRRAEGTRWEGETFSNLDLRSLKAFGSTFNNCLFAHCKLDLADFRQCRFENCGFWNCDIKLSNLSLANCENCTFSECDMEQTSFQGALFRKVEFRKCRLAFSEMLFQDVTVKDRLLLSECNLRGSSLDFRQVDEGALRVEKSSLWGAKIPMGCAFWTGSLDEDLCKQFLSLLGIASRDQRVIELAGDQYPVVCRAMFGRKRWTDPDLTSPGRTGSNQIQNSPVLTDTTAPTTPEATMKSDISPGMAEGV